MMKLEKYIRIFYAGWIFSAILVALGLLISTYELWFISVVIVLAVIHGVCFIVVAEYNKKNLVKR